MKKITILMLHLQHGGIEKQTITLANELCKHYEVEMICTYSMKTAPAYPVDQRVKIRYLMDDKPNRDEIKAAIGSKNPLSMLKQGCKAAKILYLKKALMIKAIKALKTDYVLSTRLEFAQMLTDHAPKGIVTMTQEHLHDGSDKYIARAQKAFAGLDYLLVLCDWSRENFTRWLSDNKKIKIVQIPNILESIPTETAALAGNRLVSAGRLHPVKNFETLLDVLALVRKEIPDATLTLIGGGEEYDRLQTQAKALGIENAVTFTGMVGADAVKQNMLDSDLYVMTSHTECFPMVLLEASSVGLPLVSFNVPVGPRSIIQNGENGYLVDYENKQQMADRIVGILRDRNALQKMGSNAKVMSQQYLAENIMPLWHQLFR